MQKVVIARYVLDALEMHGRGTPLPYNLILIAAL